MGRFTEELIWRLDNATEWPLAEEQDILAEIAFYIALREGDSEVLREVEEWTNQARKYRVDSLPYDISEAFANLIFGGPTEVNPADASDEDNMQRLREANDFSSVFGVEHETNSSEGEVWYRIYGDRSIADAPLFEWFSRTAVVPHFFGRQLVAVAFVNELDPLRDDPDRRRWRHFEIHERGEVTNVLYDGFDDNIAHLTINPRTLKRSEITTASTMLPTVFSGLGRRVSLNQHDQTATLLDNWEHGLPGMLAGRIINKKGSTHRVGVSDYKRVADYFLMLNESLTIGHENARLTAKKRVVVESSALDESGNLRADQEVLVADASDRVMGDKQGSGPWRVLEYSFDAEALISYKRDLIESACSRLGMQAQFVAVGNVAEGFAQSGTALKVRLLPSVNAAKGRAQYWDQEIPRAVMMAQLLDELPEDRLGFGNTWRAADQPPMFKRPPTLPEDPTEETDRDATAVGAQIKSRRTSIEERYPEWDETRVDDEMTRIEAEERIFGNNLASLFTTGGEPSPNGASGNASGESDPTLSQAG